MPQALRAAVIIGALGYFVDVYDLFLFSILRVQSLTSLGLSQEQVLETGVSLLNIQMIGMLLGGLAWGLLGDLRGRVSVLFGAILTYSVANLANAFVDSVTGYALCRFFAGFGLAGELGAAITLVSEIMPAKSRGYGTTIVTAVGLCGAVVAGFVGDLLPWRAAYALGGGAGLLLLVARFSLRESGIYDGTRARGTRRGDLRKLFGSARNLKRYLFCIVTGVPIWFVAGILITFAPEISRELGVEGEISAARVVMLSLFGGAIGGLIGGLLSQLLKSRRKVVFGSLCAMMSVILMTLLSRNVSTQTFYIFAFLLGCANGYWAVFVTIAAEQFGTDIRATVATTAPNLVRASVVPLTLVLQVLRGSYDLVSATLMVGVGCVLLALVALSQLEETYGKELDYIETL